MKKYSVATLLILVLIVLCLLMLGRVHRRLVVSINGFHQHAATITVGSGNSGICFHKIPEHFMKVTYDAYCDMIPTLTSEEKEQIMVWLVEARELAIDAESSNKKHDTFNKYKGRINNYLSARGYNIQKEREEWEKRVKARGGKL